MTAKANLATKHWLLINRYNFKVLNIFQVQERYNIAA